MDRAAEYADKINNKEVWTELGISYLKNSQFEESIDALVKANNPNFYQDLIDLNKDINNNEKLLVYFDMARKIKKDMIIDNEYIMCLAKLNRLNDIESFIKKSHSADLARTGDKLYN